jgi:hypothetical protein
MPRSREAWRLRYGTSRLQEAIAMKANKPCPIAGCRKRTERRATGLCVAHAKRKRIHGSPTGGRVTRLAYATRRRDVGRFLRRHKADEAVKAALDRLTEWIAGDDPEAMRLQGRAVTARTVLVEVVGLWLLVLARMDGDQLDCALANAALRFGAHADRGSRWDHAKQTVVVVVRKRRINGCTRRRIGAMLRSRLARVMALAMIWIESQAQYRATPPAQPSATSPTESR